MANRLFILTGASGAGKTTIMDHIRSSRPENFTLLHFDSIEIPSPGEMIRQYGSMEEWQKNKTKEWIERIQKDFLPKSDVLFEGQMRIAFIKEAISNFSNVKIILIDCNDAVRKERLSVFRKQPELASQDMMNWSAYLREEARRLGVEIIDTSFLSPEESMTRIFSEIKA